MPWPSHRLEDATRRDANNVDAFIDAARAALGPDGISTDLRTLTRYGMNITELPSKLVPVVLWPRTRAQVESIVRLANAHGCPLYPISRGRNWGLGSKLPVIHGCALVDLSRMDGILEINDRFGYAVIEPGVTQVQLAAHLASAGSSHVLNVTGSSPSTSIVGNTLDRGVGIHGQRTQDLRGLEVVLGNGRTIRTGYWHQSDEASPPPPHFYAHGLGPDVNGLFSQSSFGIVTALVIGLHPKPERRVIALLACDDARMPSLVDALYVLRRDGVVQTGIEIDTMNDHRHADFAEAKGQGRQWFAWVTVAGTGPMLDAARYLLESAVSGIVHRLELFDSASPGCDDYPLQPRIRLAYLAGQPSDFSVRAFAGSAVASLAEPDIDLDQVKTAPGLSLVLPAVPFDGAWVTTLARTVDEVSAAHGLEPAITLCGIGQTALEGFIRIGFDRSSPEMVARTHQWNEELHARLVDAGLFPYRAPVDRIASLINRPNDTFWQTIGDLKRALDPNGIIAPGRYAPSSHPG